MNMKNILIIILMLISTSLMAQQRRTSERQQDRTFDKEKLESARIAFITNRLSLTPTQAEKFWPLFNQNMEKRSDLMREMTRINRTDTKEISDSRATELINRKLEIQQNLLDIEKSFMKEITGVITPAQALQLGSVNRDFTRQLYRMQGDSRGGRHNN
jgi:Spy/CpxP family protein refolding chaperone